jgi:hypothetical protein
VSTTNWQRAWEPAPPDPGIKPNGIRARALRAVLVRGPRAETLAAAQRSWDYWNRVAPLTRRGSRPACGICSGSFSQLRCAAHGTNNAEELTGELQGGEP